MPWRFTATGLETNRGHTVTVRARDAAGNLSAPSNALRFELENQPPHPDHALAAPVLR